ncbi:MAG: SMC family ATPase [Bifidobacteriaceae bacterium]|jgi:exonuclease SbcC|nr:SMC family ATPase [Bifidobacteriaceae bacterium]
MRLHRLEFGGIGPFAGARTIDFADLTASGLFLLEGPTGAGKSTLIDALIFALYGSLGEPGAYDRLRSDYAASTEESYVDLVYEVGAGIFRIRRTPRYERARRRSASGSGLDDQDSASRTTTRNATARLWRLNSPDDQAGEIIATKVEESSTEVRRTIGLSRDQFVQTVVLPQGQFASFLKADNEDRRALLQRIFGTELYQRLADELKNRRAEADSRQRALAGQLEAAVTALGKVADLPEEARSALADAAAEVADRGGTGLSATARGDDSVLTALTGEVLSEVQATAQRAASALETATEAATLAGTAAQAAGKAASTAADRQRLANRLAELEADRPRRSAAGQALDAARRAGPIIASLDSAEASRQDLATAQAKAAGLGLDPDHLDDAALQDALEDAQSAASRAKDQLEAAKALGRATVTAEAAGKALTIAQALTEQLGEAAAEAGKRAEREAQEGPHARGEVTRLEQLGQVIAQYGKAVKAFESARGRAATAKSAYAAAQGNETRLRNARLAGLAGEMAGELQPDQPCPVCGSVDHPAPASLAPDHVTREQVEQAEAERSKAEAAYEQATGNASAAQALVSKLEGSGGNADPAETASQLAAAKIRLKELGDPGQLQAALAKAQAALEDAHRRMGQAQADTNAAHDQVVEAQSRAGGSDAATAAAILAQATGQVKSARRRLATAQDVARLAAVAESNRATAERALAEAGFADAATARAAYLDSARIDQRQSELTSLAGEEAAIEGRLAEPELAAALGDPTALADAARQAQAAAEEADASAKRLTGEAAVAGKLAESTASAAGEARQAAERLTAAKRDTAALVRVANLANAGVSNLHAVDLATYVLIRRFEEVISTANSRLGPMSDGQYSLERSDTKEATRKHRTGLALRIMDNSTGQTRDPRTLSGGETFYVSLALALGLADVVTAEAGGISLETLFVDEGFGSLSEEALESVLAQLHRIRAGGRVVGVVSHVEALKQAIPDRIEVRPSRQGGSTLRVRSAAMA